MVNRERVEKYYKGKKSGLLQLNFQENIKVVAIQKFQKRLFSFHFSLCQKVTQGQELYSLLSMVAEIGGYVGLFLGVSVNQITDLMDSFSEKCKVRWKRRKTQDTILY